MKKLLLMTAMVVLLSLLMVGMASANGGPHGGYTATTDACAGCHRAHTALGPNLLIAASTYDLCVSCHGASGAGANTNVDDGKYLSTRDDAPGGANGNVGASNTPDNADLLGGGFVNYKLAAVTSTHDPTGATAVAWGNGVARGSTAALAGGNLDCASCHDPHGTSTYRIIRETLNTATVTAAQVDEGAKDYDTEQWGAGMSTICAACHGEYHKTAAGQGSTPDGGTYTHRIDMQWDAAYAGAVNPETTGMGGFTLPLALTDSPAAGDGLVVCTTCHLPHGTSATMAGYAAGTYDPFGAGTPPGPIPSGDSALLRLDNRGVCEVCHQK